MSERLGRRGFLRAVAVGAGTLAAARPAVAQEQTSVPGATMDGDGYRPVRRAPKPGAAASMTVLERDAFEHQISCPCPCTLDVFTCRTSMPCGFSPRLHADIVALVEGGYSAPEILAAFVEAYGEQALMAPTKQGFNWVGWLAPFVAVAGGGAVLFALIRSWGSRASAPAAAALPIEVSATPEELARLDAAVREERR